MSYGGWIDWDDIVCEKASDDHFWQAILWRHARRHYTQYFQDRHFTNRNAFNELEERKKLRTSHFQSVVDLGFHENGIIHTLLTEVDFSGLIVFLSMLRKSFFVWYLYIDERCEWTKKMSDQFSTWHMDLIEGLHGICSRLRKCSQNLSVTNIANKVFYRKNKLLLLLLYLKRGYPKVYDVVMRLVKRHFNLRESMRDANARKRKATTQRIEKLVNSFGDKKKKAKKVPKPKKVTQVRENKNCRTQTKVGRRFQAEDNKRRAKERKERAAHARAMKRKNTNSKANKKKALLSINAILRKADVHGLHRSFADYRQTLGGGYTADEELAQPDNDDIMELDEEKGDIELFEEVNEDCEVYDDDDDEDDEDDEI